MGRGRAKEDAAISTRGENDFLRAETMQRSVIKLPSRDTAANAIFHNQVEREIFDKELGIITKALPVKRMKHGVTRPVRRRACALHRRALAKFCRVTTKGTLINLAIFVPRKRHTPMLKLINRLRGFAAQIFNTVLVAEPIRAFDSVIHVPAPIIGSHISKGGCDAALRRNRMRTRWENFCDASCL